MKIYKGKRIKGTGEKIRVTVNGDPLPVVRIRGRGYFDWGNGGFAAAILARSILDDFTGDCQVAWEFYQEFKRDIIAKLPRDRFELTGETIKNWFSKYDT